MILLCIENYLHAMYKNLDKNFLLFPIPRGNENIKKSFLNYRQLLNIISCLSLTFLSEHTVEPNRLKVYSIQGNVEFMLYMSSIITMFSLEKLFYCSLLKKA